MVRSVTLALLLFTGLAHAGGGGVAHKPDGRPLRLFHATPSLRGTILMFHGFAQGPRLWEDEAQQRFAEGYDVLVAALPGHGFVTKDGKADVSRVPTATQWEKYTKFAAAMFELARSRADKVHVVGFSVGGAHALEVALAQKDVRAKDGTLALRSTVAIAPYIAPTPSKLGPFHVDEDRLVDLADHLTFGLVAKRLMKKPFVFESAVEREKRASHEVGFTTVSYNHILGIGRFGDEVRHRAEQLDAPLVQPTYVVVSDRDPTANPKKGLEVAHELGARTLVLPLAVHDVISPDSNPDAITRKQVHDTITEALERGEALR